MASPVSDRQWLRHAFMLPPPAKKARYGSGTQQRYSTSAAWKFTNTSLGGNFAINNPPQFTRYADIRQPGKGRSLDERNQGMGRYYSEAIDDPKQVVHMTFGVPQYNSMSNFFTNFYDSQMASLANTGRISRLAYEVGIFAGFIVSLPLQLPLQAASMAMRAWKFLTFQSPSKWYYFKPNMHAYWSGVNVMANELAINTGLMPRFFSQEQDLMQDPGHKVTEQDIATMYRLMPHLFRERGGIDVMALANRTQRIADQSQLAMKRQRESASNIGDLQRRMRDFILEAPKDPNPNVNARDYFINAINVENNKEKVGNTSESFSSWSSLEGVYNFVKASQRDGAQIATFRVNNNGAVSESFNNATRDSELQQKMNSQVQAGRTASFNFMGGNIIPGVGAALDAVQAFLVGAADAVNLGGLATLAGSAFIDMPKVWDGSTANLPTAQYTVPLYSPYGNKISRFMNLYIPICMLLGGVLPMATGPSSHTSPFLCQIHHQGRCHIKLGMIDSLTITRGTGNVGWNAENEMLGAEITFSVVDMSSILSMPLKGAFARGASAVGTAARGGAAAVGEAIAGDAGIAAGLALTGAPIFDEESSFNDYMGVLGSLSTADSFYASRRLNLNITRSIESFKSWRSPSNLLSYALDSVPARALSAFAQTTDRF